MNLVIHKGPATPMPSFGRARLNGWVEPLLAGAFAGTNPLPNPNPAESDASEHSRAVVALC